MRTIARVDGTQRAITAALREAGCSVQPIHQLGKGIPDLLLGRGSQNFLIECKRAGSPSQRKLTEPEIAWHLAWRGQIAIAQTIEEALRIVGLIT